VTEGSIQRSGRDVSFTMKQDAVHAEGRLFGNRSSAGHIP